jgi:hypothetical protein
MNRICQFAFTAVLAGFAGTLAGCGSGHVPVSGIVTVDGKPYRNAVVMFQPIGTHDNPNPGRGSTGSTDENGRFHLKSVDGKRGAVVGKHRIRITTRYSEKLAGYEVWDAAKNEFVKSASDPIPPEWNHNSDKEFDVPARGTSEANFDIVSKK